MFRIRAGTPSASSNTNCKIPHPSPTKCSVVRTRNSSWAVLSFSGGRVYAVRFSAACRKAKASVGVVPWALQGIIVNVKRATGSSAARKFIKASVHDSNAQAQSATHTQKPATG
jgi:hypothetical protein